MAIKPLLAAALLLLGTTAARADYLFDVSWSATWVVDPGFPTEDPPNGTIWGSVIMRTPSAAGTYSYYAPIDQGDTDIHISLAIEPDAALPGTGDAVGFSGSFSTMLDGAYASTWSLSGLGPGATTDLLGSTFLDTIESPYGGIGYGDAEAQFLASDVPEPASGAMLLLGLAVVRRRVRRT